MYKVKYFTIIVFSFNLTVLCNALILLYFLILTTFMPSLDLLFDLNWGKKVVENKLIRGENDWKSQNRLFKGISVITVDFTFPWCFGMLQRCQILSSMAIGVRCTILFVGWKWGILGHILGCIWQILLCSCWIYLHTRISKIRVGREKCRV